jgi:hypothetical protein
MVATCGRTAAEKRNASSWEAKRVSGRRWADLRRLALGGLWGLGLLHAATAGAQALSPEVSRGLAWLQGQVQANGSLANEASSVATGLQSRTEAAQTFKLLSAIPARCPRDYFRAGFDR